MKAKKIRKPRSLDLKDNNVFVECDEDFLEILSFVCSPSVVLTPKDVKKLIKFGSIWLAWREQEVEK